MPGFFYARRPGAQRCVVRDARERSRDSVL